MAVAEEVVERDIRRIDKTILPGFVALPSCCRTRSASLWRTRRLPSPRLPPARPLPFHCRHPFLEHGIGGVHDAGIDVARHLEVEKIGTVLGVVEGV